MSLRYRLNLLITLLLLGFIGVVGSVLTIGMRDSIQEGVESANRVTIQLLETVIVSSFQNPEWGYTHDVMRRFLHKLGHVRSSEIRLYDIRGDLIYQSPPSKYRFDTSPPSWFVKLVQPKKEIVTRRIRYGFLVVESEPSGAIREAWGRINNLFWIGLIFFLLFNIAVYWMLGRWIKPLKAVVDSINRMEQGDLTARMPAFTLPEFSRISQNFNLMGESLQARAEENRRLALIVKQSADAMMIHDLNGNISFWNPAAQRMFGYAPEDIIGHSASLLSVPGQEAELEQNLAAIAAKRNIDHYDTQRITRDGSLKDISLSAAPLIDPLTGDVIGEICSMRDITERKQAELVQQKLEENRHLTQVIQSHIEDERRSLARELHDELGQYVTAIKTFAVAIANKTRQQMPDVESNAQTIVAAANHIYDGMHDIIRRLRPGSLDNLGLPETLRDSVSNWQKQHPEISFKLGLSGDLIGLGETININFYRIIQEAVTNALRHAQASTIEISLEQTESGDIDLRIRDDGVGMMTCNVDQTRHFGLLGIRERVQALQGSFNIETSQQTGTEIQVRLTNTRNHAET